MGHGIYHASLRVRCTGLYALHSKSVLYLIVVVMRCNSYVRLVFHALEINTFYMRITVPSFRCKHLTSYRWADVSWTQLEMIRACKAVIAGERM